MKSIIDYNDIRQSVQLELGAQNEGWIRIVSEAFALIKEYCDGKQIPLPAVAQVKQKLGELRIYYLQYPEDPYIQTCTKQAQLRTSRSCEQCGNATTPQLIGSCIANLCCWCAHKEAEEWGINLSREGFNQHKLNHSLRCQSCGYIVQIAWPASGHRCPSCVSKGW